MKERKKERKIDRQIDRQIDRKEQRKKEWMNERKKDERKKKNIYDCLLPMPRNRPIFSHTPLADVISDTSARCLMKRERESREIQQYILHYLPLAVWHKHRHLANVRSTEHRTTSGRKEDVPSVCFVDRCKLKTPRSNTIAVWPFFF